jgi:hypothetical protein
MPLKLKLTWIGSLKQWRKRYKGETYYLGTGKDKADLESYRRAVAKWEAKKTELDAAEQKVLAEQRLDEHRRSYTQWGMFLASQDKTAGRATEPEPLTPERIEEIDQRWAEHPDRGIGEAGRLAMRMVKAGNSRPSAPGGKTVGELLDLFLAEQQKRNERRHFIRTQKDNGQNVSEKSRDGLSDGRFISIRIYAGQMKSLFGNEPFDGTEQASSSLLKRWRDDSEKLMIAGRFKPNTFNERIKVGRQFVGWLHQNYHLQGLPRGIKDLCGKYEYKPNAKALELPTIRKIWIAANVRMKAWIALALNVGFYAADIADLKDKEIVGGYIVKERGKTGVPTRLVSFRQACLT